MIKPKWGRHHGRYILDGKVPKPEPDLMKWAMALEARWARKKDDWRVASDEHQGVRVSTVFLGLDHNFSGGTPLLFETITFTDVGPLDGDRCSTWGQAEAQHRRICKERGVPCTSLPPEKPVAPAKVKKPDQAKS